MDIIIKNKILLNYRRGLHFMQFLILAILCYQPVIAQDKSIYCEEFRTVYDTFLINEYNDISITDTIARDVYTSIIEALDPNSIYFNLEEIIELKKLQKSIRDDIHNSYCNDISWLLNLYTTSLNRTIRILNTINESELSLTDKDSIPLLKNSNASFDYYKLNQEYRIKLWIKYQILYNQIYDPSDNELGVNSPDSIQQIFNKEKQRSIDFEITRVNNILNSAPSLEYFVFNKYTNCVLTRLDPHSYFFSKETFDEFKEHLSFESNSYGIGIEENQEGDIVIDEIVPGGSAWKSGKLNIGDKLICIKIEGKEALENENIQLNTIYEYLASSNSEILEITVEKEFKTRETVTLSKEKIENTDVIIQSYILDGTVKIGYIILPAFYTNWENAGYSGCAQDVAKAIISLKKKGIQALILDLRDNGGGSIYEAVELAGIFIDFGTLAIAENKQKNLQNLKDFNRGTIYSGPLALMVNGGSASASEMVAAILKDYNRAIIVGNKTFGKATGQTIIPMDKFRKIFTEGDLEQVNTIKVTTNKYYRITGRSYQKIGVIPDILFPEIHNIFDYSENDLPNALNYSSVNKIIYYTALVPYPIDSLKMSSELRIRSNAKFQLVLRIDSIFDKFMDDYHYLPLDLFGYINYTNKSLQIIKYIDLLSSERTTVFTVDNLQADKNMIALFEFYTKQNKEIVESVTTDPYIEETYNVLSDYIQKK